ncbi:MAG: DNA repair protein RadC [Muribaculaceae bacterium]|nr:DNA repair protein RadC [Roseburia sp.]MCM1430952.1 DNA repair protein RadC [Muribaculaceae bacterium]MCM1493900.1 DNA repair protein RadC [Muribaculaceae bacterium]
MSHTTVKNLPESERPYERFRRLGAEALSDAELLAIILKTGTKGLTSLELARKLLSECHGNLLNLHALSYGELVKRRGIGPVKAIQLKAIAELSNRIARTTSGYQMSFQSPESIAVYYMETMRHRREEVLMAAFFDAKFNFLGDDIIARGGMNCAYVTPAELFRRAILANALQIILLHNHPSGDCHPSEADLLLTERLVQGAKLLGLHVEDHIVIGDKCYYSFRENEIMP